MQSTSITRTVSRTEEDLGVQRPPALAGGANDLDRGGADRTDRDQLPNSSRQLGQDNLLNTSGGRDQDVSLLTSDQDEGTDKEDNGGQEVSGFGGSVRV
jgi:hypothetical protein